MSTYLIQKLSSLSLCLWWGGLTFYAAAVVPIGTDLFGAEMQGMVTQQATNWLNFLGWVAVALWAIRHNTTLFRNRQILIPWLITVLSLVVLFVIHKRLDAFLAEDS
ncbi:MAG: hypothetical protein AAF497_15150 [Planctomycetota bacterium]